MTKNDYSLNNFLGRWLNDDLEASELSRFESTKDYEVFSRILTAVDTLKVPHKTTNEEDYKVVKERIDLYNSMDSDDQAYFLGRWLNEDSTNSEMAEFNASEKIKDFSRILSAVDTLKVPHKTTNEEDFAELMSKISAPKSKVVRLSSVSSIFRIAASVIIIIGISFFLLAKSVFQTTAGQRQTLNLPDGSTIVLNSNSKASYKTFSYFLFRNIKLEGEAYFEVAKGKKFVVNTPQGEIAVLGTKFNVLSRENIFSTHCFEGKVQVNYNGKKDILTHGDKLDYFKIQRIYNEDVSSSKPEWIQNKQSKFKNVSLDFVLSEFKNYYTVDFVYDTNTIVLEKLFFTGVFNHENLDDALESIFLPMNIKYQKDGNKIYLNKK